MTRQACGAPGRRATRWALAVAVLLAAPGAVMAQASEPPCTYETCALRLRPAGLLSRSEVVRGIEGLAVAGYGPSTDLGDLFAADDSAASHYEAFVGQYRVASRVGWLGLGLALGGLIAEMRADAHPSGWGVGLLAGGYTMFFVATIPGRRAADAFSQAIWWYNRSLPGEPDAGR